jgi:rRNA maturation endonuclease Nob1
MPDEITEARELYLTAIANSELAYDALEAAEQELEEARQREAAGHIAATAANSAEQQARDRYVTALRANNYVDTATGPMTPADAAQLAAADYGAEASLADCGCPVAYITDHGNHQEGCDFYRPHPLAPTAAELARGRASAQQLAAERPGNLSELA